MRVERLLAGFDAGQTHTTCRLAVGEAGAAPGGLRVLAEGEGPGVCHLAAPEGPARFREALRLSLAAALRSLGEGGAVGPLLPDGDPVPGALRAAAVGASGIEQGSEGQGRGRALAAQALELPQERLLVTGDERTALRGAFPEGPGIVVISGTGTIAVGRDGRGREHRCAGWGWLLDGAGSAMDIGRDGLALALRMADGRRTETALRPALWRALDLDPRDPQSAQKLKAKVVAADFGAAGFARLAPVVAAMAADGDAGALGILERSAAALAEMVAGVAGALGLDGPPVCAMGGAIENLTPFRSAFEGQLAAVVPGSRLQAPRGDACAGALALAAELAGGG